MKGGRNPDAKALRSYRAQVIGNKKRDAGKWREDMQGGAVPRRGSYPRSSEFDSRPCTLKDEGKK